MKKFALKIFIVTICLASTPMSHAGNDHAFLWSAETGLQDLGTLGGSSSVAAAVNDDGTVVGYSDTAEGATHAFLWTAAEGMQDLGVPGNGFYDTSFARAINNKGEVSGGISNSSGKEAAFYWSATTGFIVLRRGNLSEGSGINDLGTVTGFEGTVELEAVLWNPARGKLTFLGFLPGGTQSSSNDVNNLGNVAGQAVTSLGDFHPFYWSPATGMVDLGVLPNEDLGVASAIDDYDEVVGESYQSDGRGSVGFYWSQSTGMVELITPPERTFTTVSGINNRGMIVGASSGVPAPLRAVVWESYTSVPRALGTLPGGSVSAASGLNNRGQVVGWADVP
jgi:probable HAF family extracellular repeat protein